MADYINLVGPNGERTKIEARGLEYAISKGYREATPEDLKAEKIADIKKEAYDTPLGKVAAASTSLLNTMTFGASDAAWKNLAPESFETVKGVREENPKSSMLGTGAGFLTGVGMAKGALQGVTKAGQAVGGKVAATGAGKVASKVAQYGTEGALISLPAGATELITGSPEEAAETLIFGTAIGGGFGGVAGVLPSFMKAASSTKKVVPHLGDGLKRAQLDQGGKVLGFTLGVRNKMNRVNASRADELVEWADKKGIIKVLNRTEDMHLAVTDMAEQAGKELGKVAKEIDKTGKYFIDTAKILQRLESMKVPQGQLLAPERRAYQKALSDTKALIVTPKTGEPRFVKMQKLWEHRQTLDKYTYKEHGEVKPGRDLVRDMRRIVEDEIVAGVTAAEKTLPGQAKRWLQAKQDYGNYEALIKPLQNKLNAEAGNQFFRPSDFGASILGGTVGGPAGALGGYVVNVLQKQYGAQLAYRSIKTINNLNKRRDQMIERSVNNFFAVTQKASLGDALTPASVGAFARMTGESSSPSTSRAAQYAKLEEQLAAATTNPRRAVEVLADLTGGMASTAPEVSGALQNKTMEVVSYLHSKAPKPKYAPNPLTQRQFVPSSRELVSFEARVQAAIEPYSVLKDLNNGILQKESVETIRDLYPNFHQKLQSKILEGVTGNKRLMGYAQRKNLSAIMGIEMDELLKQRNIKALQATYQQQQQQGAPPKANRLKSTQNQMSDVQRVTYK